MGNKNRRRALASRIDKLRRLASNKKRPKRASRVGEAKGS